MKWLIISGLFSRTVRAARELVLERGICPTTRRFSGARNLKDALIRRQPHNGDFMRLNGEVFANQFRCAVQLDEIPLAALVGKFVHPFFQFADVFASHVQVTCPTGCLAQDTTVKDFIERSSRFVGSHLATSFRALLRADGRIRERLLV